MAGTSGPTLLRSEIVSLLEDLWTVLVKPGEWKGGVFQSPEKPDEAKNPSLQGDVGKLLTVITNVKIKKPSHLDETDKDNIALFFNRVGIEFIHILNAGEEKNKLKILFTKLHLTHLLPKEEVSIEEKKDIPIPSTTAETIREYRAKLALPSPAISNSTKAKYHRKILLDKDSTSEEKSAARKFLNDQFLILRKTRCENSAELAIAINCLLAGIISVDNLRAVRRTVFFPLGYSDPIV
jgi:hypothetical protein